MHKNICKALKAHLEHKGESTAYTFLNESGQPQNEMSYSQLDYYASIVARQLIDNAEQGDRVLLIFKPGLEFIVSYIGCLYAGMIAIPIHPPKFKRNAVFLKNTLEDSGANVILANQDIVTDGVNHFSSDAKFQSLLWLPVSYPLRSSKQELSFVLGDIADDSIAFLQYTSGSTSAPKGVMVSHNNLILNIDELCRCYEHDQDSIMVSWIPHFHDLGLIYGILVPLYMGTPCFLMAPAAFVRNPVMWLQAITDFKGTHSAAPNSAYQLCVDKISSEERDKLSLSSWKVAANAAEPVRLETLNQFSDTFSSCQFASNALTPSYGLAEATVKVAISDVSSEPYTLEVDTNQLSDGVIKTDSITLNNTRHLVASGRVNRDTKSIIVDPSSSTKSPPQEIGEVWVAGPSVATGYWGLEKETQATFHAQLADDPSKKNYLRTGDLGFIQDNELFITGRIKDLIIIDGVNYYPQDIELSIIQCDGTLNPDHAAAFSAEISGQERIIVVLEVKRTAIKKLNPAALFKKIQSAVFTEYEVELYDIVLIKPASVFKTSSGKIQRQANKAAYLTNGLRVIESLRNLSHSHRGSINVDAKSLSLSQIEHWLTEQISVMTGVDIELISEFTTYTDSGLTSKSLLILAANIERDLGIKCSPVALFDHPTINTLAQFLERTSTQDTDQTKKAPELSSVSNSKGTSDDLAIIGMSCRFPGAQTAEEFWSVLSENKDCVSEMPSDRWHGQMATGSSAINKQKQYAGVLKDIDKFDSEFFNISPREAQQMDPQQRLLLEVSWGALEDAGLSVKQVKNTKTGVFFGISNGEFQRIGYADKRNLSMYTATGSSPSIAAGRLSFLWDLKGPAMVIDTACSSSLVAVHQACESILNGESDLAFAGGVNLILTPESTVSLDRGNMLSTDGRCKTFDEAANGYVRGEGCGVVFLKRLKEAKRDGDSIYAVIKGSSVGQDGNTTGLTAPNGKAQRDVVRSALHKSGVKPHELSYVEAHGTGTPLGDPIELNSLSTVLEQGRSKTQPCLIGSVKTNIGHLEAAAGIAGLIKTALALSHKQVPANLHFNTINPIVEFDHTLFSIPVKNHHWQGNRFAGVSSFGFSGTNAHVILASHQDEKVSADSQTHAKQKEPTTSLLALSAASPEALIALAQRHSEQLLKQAGTDKDWLDYSFSNNNSRSLHKYRLAITSDRGIDAAQALNNYCQKPEPTRLLPNRTPDVAFLFTGQGAQYNGMLKQLYQSEQLVKNILDHCNSLASAFLGYDLLGLMFAQPVADSTTTDGQILSHTANTQPALFICEIALAKLWMSKGIQPSIVMGHSIGEYAAAHIAGILSLEDALTLVLTRGRLMQALPSGKMIAVFANKSVVKRHLESMNPDDDISIAADNGPNNVVVSGSIESITQFTARLDSQKIDHRPLDVSHAFHSPMMKPMISEFKSVLESVQFSSPVIPLISNLTADLCDEEICSTEYWLKHTLSPVEFQSSIQVAAAQKINLFIEVGPGSTLLNLGRQCLADKPVHWLRSMTNDGDERETFLNNLGDAFCLGAEVDFSTFEGHKRLRSFSLPSYPFQRKRYWPEIDKHQHESNTHPLLGSQTPLASSQGVLYTKHLNSFEHEYLSGHVINDIVIFPGAGFIEIAHAVAKQYWQDEAISCHSIEFHQPLMLGDLSNSTLQCQVSQPESSSDNKQQAQLSILSLTEPSTQWVLNATLTIQLGGAHELPSLKIPSNSQLGLFKQTISGKQFYQHWHANGNNWHGVFQGIKNLWLNSKEAWGQIEAEQLNAGKMQPYCVHPAILDSCAQVFAVLFQETRNGAFVGHSVDKITFFEQSHSQQYWVHAEVEERTPELSVNQEIGSLTILDGKGILVAKLSGLVFSFLEQESPTTHNDAQLMQLSWEAKPDVEIEHNTITTQSVSCLVVHNESASDKPNTLVEQLQNKGLKANTQSLASAVLAETIQECQPDFVIAWIEPKPAINADSLDYLAEQLNCLKEIILNCEQTQSKLWVLTEHSWLLTPVTGEVTSAKQLVNPYSTAIWGFARSLSAERENNWGGILDLDDSTPIEQQCQAIASLLTDKQWANQLALRNNQIYKARLSPINVRAYEQTATLEIRKESSYLITGGLGELGLQWAQWLASLGARRLILISRTQLPPRSTWQSTQHSPEIFHKIATITEIEKAGAQVTAVSLDVSKEQEFEHWLENFHSQQPPIMGVIHTAGTVHRLGLEELTPTQLKNDLEAKVGGASVIDRFFPVGQLDFLLLFSSASAALPSAYLSSYAASNAWLDGLAARRKESAKLRSKKRSKKNTEKIVAVQWGAFSDIGMMARHDKALSSKGLRPDDGTQLTPLLFQLAEQETTSSVLVLSDSDDAISQLSELGENTFYDYLTLNQATTETDLAAGLTNHEKIKNGNAHLDKLDVSSLLSLSHDERISTIQQWLSNTLSHVLMAATDSIDINTSFAQYGLDSLMALNVKNSISAAFNVSISIFDIQKFNNIEVLSSFIETLVLSSEKQTNEPSDTVSIAENQLVFDLSYNQKAQWFLFQMDPLNSAYHVSFTARIHGEFDVELFNQFMFNIIDCNPTLKTHFSVENKPIQKILTSFEFETESVRVAGKTENEIKQRIKKCYQTPFDFDNKLLIRAHEFKLNETESILLLVAHHIICDGWSLWSLLDQLKSLYLSHSGQNANSVIPAKYSTADFVKWQTELVASEKGQHLWNFWHKTLGQDNEQDRWQLALPTNQKARSQETDKPAKEGRSVHFKLSPTLSAHLRQQAKHQGTTLFSILLSAYQILLHKLTNQETLLVGTPYHGRSKVEFENTIGDFVNLVPIKSHFEPTQTLSSYLKSQNEIILDALQHADYPLSLLIEKLGIKRKAQGASLIQTTFIMQQPQKDKDMMDLFLSAKDDSDKGPNKQNWGDLVLSPYVFPQQEGQFDLSLEIADNETQLEGFFKYDHNSFTESRVTEISQHYLTLLALFDTEINQRLNSVSLLERDTKALILNEFNNPLFNKPAITSKNTASQCNLASSDNLIDGFKHSVLTKSETVAVTDGVNSLTFSELDTQSNTIANSLLRLADRGGIVGLSLGRNTALITGILGILKSDNAYLPLDASHPAERLQHQVLEAKAQYIITDRETSLTLKSKLNDITLLCVEDLLDSPDVTAPDVTISSTNLAYILYTSGSTGQPKGILVEHGSVMNLVDSISTYILNSMDTESSVALVANTIFDASVQQIFSSLLLGQTLVVVNEQTRGDAKLLIELFVKHHVKVTDFTPSLFSLLVDHLESSQTDLPLDTILVGGEPLPGKLVSRFFKVNNQTEIINVYGPSECCVDSTYYPVSRNESRAADIVPIGYPLKNTQIFIVDQWNQPVPLGISGEILIAGKGLARGYLAREELNQKAFISAPWLTEQRLYKTGDSGFWDENGLIHYVERMDQQVKIRGHRIELGEIEQTLRQHPNIMNCSVVTNNDNTSLIAYIVNKPANSDVTGEPIDSGNLKQYLMNKLPNYMVPSFFMPLDKLPLTTNGKLDKKALPPVVLENSNLGGQAINEIETKVSAIWCECLQLKQVGRKDNFFDLGGHSLLLAQLQRKLNDVFEKQISMVDLFANPTVSGCSTLFISSAPTDEKSTSETSGKKSNRQNVRQQQIKRQRANRRALRNTNSEA